jgi:ABC-type dipeptide/oligopeptide/nickel transport system permease component
MYKVCTYKSNIPGYIFRRVLVAVIAFFVISLIVTLVVYIAGMPEITNIEWLRLSPSEQEELQEELLSKGPQLEGYYPSYPVYYINWIGGVFTGDWGESLMPASYYAE